MKTLLAIFLTIQAAFAHDPAANKLEKDINACKRRNPSTTYRRCFEVYSMEFKAKIAIDCTKNANIYSNKERVEFCKDLVRHLHGH